MIKRLYTIFYSSLFSKKTTRQDKNINIKKCTICMEEIFNNNVCQLSCGHYYCLDCIIELKKHSNKCPCCRSVVFNNDNSNEINELNENNQKQSSIIDVEIITHSPSAPPPPPPPPEPETSTYDIGKTVLYVNTNTHKPYTFEQYESELPDDVKKMHQMFMS